jgi:hypothetical protein
MFTDQQKAKYVLWYEFYESSAAVRRKFRPFYHCIIIKLHRRKCNIALVAKFEETGSLVLRPMQY